MHHRNIRVFDWIECDDDEAKYPALNDYDQKDGFDLFGLSAIF